MFYAFPSFLSHHTLRSGAQRTQSQLRQLFPQHGSLFTPLRAAPNQALHRAFHNTASPVARAVRNAGAKEKGGLSFLLKGATIAGVGLGLANQRSSIIHCEAPQPKLNTPAPIYPDERGPPPASSVSVYELGFGTVAGICAGVFLKKGAKALAFLLGGVFVLLQYLGSASLVRVDWGRAAGKFEDAFHSTDPKTGVSRAPNVVRLWNWLIDFLTADFQPRASFVAGFALGLRIG